MRVTLLTILSLFAFAAAQESSSPATPATPTTDTSAADSEDASDTFTAPPEQDTTLPWNITYFIVPTRNNYWVLDATNSAKWTPVNMPTNLLLSNSNGSIAANRVVLAQNQAAGVSTWTGKISGYTPGNNYLLQLTLAGNPDQKFAQSQGFWIKPNGTAMAQQIIEAGGAPAGAAGAAASGPAPGSNPNGDANGGTGATPADGSAAGTNAAAAPPNTGSGASSSSAVSGTLALALIAGAVALVM